MKTDSVIEAEKRFLRVEREFKHWRENPERKGQTRIPDNLWSLACGLRSDFSDGRICGRLQLNRKSYFRVVEERGLAKPLKNPKVTSDFGLMEIPASLFSNTAMQDPIRGIDASIEIEMTRVDGAQMKMRLHGDVGVRSIQEAMRHFLAPPSSSGASSC